MSLTKALLFNKKTKTVKYCLYVEWLITVIWLWSPMINTKLICSWKQQASSNLVNLTMSLVSMCVFVTERHDLEHKNFLLCEIITIWPCEFFGSVKRSFSLNLQNMGEPTPFILWSLVLGTCVLCTSWCCAAVNCFKTQNSYDWNRQNHVPAAVLIYLIAFCYLLIGNIWFNCFQCDWD